MNTTEKNIQANSLAPMGTTLSKEMREAAEHYALSCIAMEDVEEVLGIPRESLPQEFHDYVEEFTANYEKWLDENYGAPEVKLFSDEEKKLAEKYVYYGDEQAVIDYYGGEEWPAAFHSYVDYLWDNLTLSYTLG